MTSRKGEPKGKDRAGDIRVRRLPGFARTFSVTTNDVTTKCMYCGAGFAGPPEAVGTFEENHRTACDQPRYA